MADSTITFAFKVDSSEAKSRLNELQGQLRKTASGNSFGPLKGTWIPSESN